MNWYKKAALGNNAPWIMPDTVQTLSKRPEVIHALHDAIQANAAYLAQLALLDHQKQGNNVSKWVAKAVETIASREVVKNQQPS